VQLPSHRRGLRRHVEPARSGGVIASRCMRSSLMIWVRRPVDELAAKPGDFPPPGGTSVMWRPGGAHLVAVVARVISRHVGCAVAESLVGGAQAAHVSTDWNADVVAMQGLTPQHVERFLASVRATQAREPDIVLSSPLSVVVRLRTPADGVFAALMRARLSVLWPGVWHDGLEKYHVIAKDHSELAEAVRELSVLGPVELEDVAELAPGTIGVSAPLGHLVAGLTKKQLEAFRLAVESGYYETPRIQRTIQLAERMGVTRTTFEEHLRKAERRVFPRVAAIIAAHPGLAESARGGPGRPRKHPRKGA